MINKTRYFADGVQDQILTNLARVADLRVISHTTVRQYKKWRATKSARDRSTTRRYSHS